MAENSLQDDLFRNPSWRADALLLAPLREGQPLLHRLPLGLTHTHPAQGKPAAPANDSFDVE